MEMPNPHNDMDSSFLSDTSYARPIIFGLILLVLLILGTICLTHYNSKLEESAQEAKSPPKTQH